MHIPTSTLIDNRFEITGVIGKGGMAVVYEGRNIRLGQKVALKVMHSSVMNSRTGMERFLREGAAMANITHPNIARVHDVAEYMGAPILVMELLHGESLAQRIDRKWMPSVSELVELADQMLDALQYAHARAHDPTHLPTLASPPIF